MVRSYLEILYSDQTVSKYTKEKKTDFFFFFFQLELFTKVRFLEATDLRPGQLY